MDCNLALKILMYVVDKQSSLGASHVSLATLRLKYDIPATTFYRHLRSLIDDGIVIKIERDKYRLSHEFCDKISRIPYQKRLSGIDDPDDTYYQSAY